MRRLAALVLCATLTTACSRRKPVVETIEESQSSLASVIHVADPAVASQLIHGFYDVEANAWRWTMGKFSVVLSPPAGAKEKGATLVLRFSLPERVLAELQSVTISASVNGFPLAPETYKKSGEQVYRRDVPANAIAGSDAKVDFALLRSLQPGALDERELGIIASSIGFESK